MRDMNLTRIGFNSGKHTSRSRSLGSKTSSDAEICDYARQRPQRDPSSWRTRGRSLPHALEDCEPESIRRAIVTLDCTDKPRARVLPLCQPACQWKARCSRLRATLLSEAYGQAAFAKIRFNVGTSSNGKTADSGSAYRGSNPCVPAKNARHTAFDVPEALKSQ
jgi:hypothetical protein